MVDLYLINIESGPDSIEEPVRADQALTVNREVWIWGMEGLEVEFELPNHGDIAIFYDSTDIFGVGEVWDSSNSKALTSYFEQIAGEGFTDVNSVITLVNYQQIKSWEPGWITELFDLSEEDRSARRWIESLPEIHKVPGEIFSGPEGNIRLILDRLPIDSSEFGSLPSDGGRDPQEPEQGFSPDDGDGELDSVDRTGPLLAQQYVSRDTLQQAAKGSVQIIILLFGIMIAALSFIRKAPSQAQDATTEALSITTPLVVSLVGISIATLGSAFLLTITATRPRPFSQQLAEKQSKVNILVDNTTDENEKSEIINDFSKIYHEKVQKIQTWNSRIGAGIGGTIGIAIASSVLFGYETLTQIFPKYGDYWVLVILFCVIMLLLVPVGYYFAK